MAGWYGNINLSRRKNIGDFRIDLEFSENLYCWLFIQIS